MNTFALLYLFSCLLLVFHEVTSVEIREITDDDNNKPSGGNQIYKSQGYQRQSSKNEPTEHHVEEHVNPEDESKMQIVLSKNGKPTNRLYEGPNEDLNLHDDQGYSSEQNITPVGIFAVFDWLRKMPYPGQSQIHETGHGTDSSMDPDTRARILTANITPKGLKILLQWLREIPLMNVDQMKVENHKDFVGDKSTQAEAQPSRLQNKNSDVGSTGKPNKNPMFNVRRSVYKLDSNGKPVEIANQEHNFDLSELDDDSNDNSQVKQTSSRERPARQRWVNVYGDVPGPTPRNRQQFVRRPMGSPPPPFGSPYKPQLSPFGPPKFILRVPPPPFDEFEPFGPFDPFRRRADPY